MEFDKGESYKQFLKCKKDNERFNNGFATITFSKNNIKIGGIFCIISFQICENKKTGMIIAEKCDGLLPDTVYTTEKCKFEYNHSKTKEGEERKLTITRYNSESIEIQFDTIPPIKEYDSEELTSFSPKNVKDMTKEELFNELCANIEETKQVHRLSESGVFPKDEAKKIIEKNGKRNAEISKEFANRNQI